MQMILHIKPHLKFQCNWIEDDLHLNIALKILNVNMAIYLPFTDLLIKYWLEKCKLISLNVAKT